MAVTPDKMHDEWQAWQLVVAELRGASAALDINKEDRLNAALVIWGEMLANLRCEQDPETRENALWDALTLGKTHGVVRS